VDKLGAVYLQHLSKLPDRFSYHLLRENGGQDEYGFILIHERIFLRGAKIRKKKIKTYYICKVESYLVSFRRHRPDSFMSVVGQSHITQTLKNAIRSDKLAQAMLFCGPRGVGKTTCARILAKSINCLQPTEDAEACGQCKNCIAIREGGSLAIYELDAASNNSVDDIRNLVEQVRYPPQGGKFKVYIIDEVHMLSTAAFNAFLKTLEEPPPYAIFILATTEKHKILPTILSRCQVYHFNRIRLPDIAGELERVCKADGIPYEEQALFSLAEKADGALRDALSMLDQIVGFSGGQLRLEDVVKNLNLLDSRCFFDATDYILSGDLTSLLLLVQKIVIDGFETDAFVAGLASHWRLLLLARDERTRELLEVGGDCLPLYVGQAQQLSLDIHLSGLNLLAQAELNHRQSRNPRLHTEMALAKLCYARQLLLAPDSDIPEATEAVGGRLELTAPIQAAGNPKSTAVSASSQTSPGNSNQGPKVNIKIEQPAEAVQAQSPADLPTPQTPDQSETAVEKTLMHSAVGNKTESPVAAPAAPIPSPQKMAETPVKVSKIKSPQLHPIQSASEKADSNASESFSDPFTAAKTINLQEAWGRMLEKLLKEGRKYVHSALAQIKPELNIASEIEIPIEHDALRTALGEMTFDLTNQLRTLTGIQELQMKMISAAPDSLPSKFATLTHKKQWLLDHYPKINTFIQKIGLDWTY
jgi:DNA polymerase-3 subunit gamma/tau